METKIVTRLAHELVEDAPEIAAGDGIDAVGRLVEKQHARRVDERAGEAELLLHAAGEVAGEALPERGEIAEAEQPVDLLGAAADGHAVDVGVESDVLHHREVRIKAEALAHVADVLLEALGVAHDIEARHLGGAAAGSEQDAGEHAHGGRLAGAVGADEAEDLAVGDVEVEPCDGDEVVEGAAQAVGTDGGHGSEAREARRFRARPG